MSTISSRFGLSSFNFVPNLRFRGSSGRLSGAGSGWIEILLQRSVQRRQLIEMEDSQLLDMGISRAEAEREARKPFWRA